MKRYYFMKLDSEIIEADTEYEARVALAMFVSDESEWNLESVENIDG